jgi:putative peptidoglycan lipid II flippase
MAPATTDESSPSQSATDRIAHAAGLAAAATLTSRVLGLAREQVLAAYFGAGDQMDAYFVAFRIPNLVRDLFAEGAMSSAFVPTFTRHLTLRGKDDAWRLGNNVLTALLIVTGLSVGVGLVFARPIVSLYAGRFAAVPGKLDLAAQLARVMMPYLLLAAIAAAFMGMLNSLRHYFLPALAPATFNIVAILSALLLTPLMPMAGWPPIMSVAIGVTGGGIAQAVIQWPLMRREGFRYRPMLDVRDPGLRQVLLLMGPGTIGLAATQVNLFVSTLLASGQGTGAVSWLQYAFRVMYLPLGLFGVSIATAVLPAAARHAAVMDKSAVRDTVRRGLSLMLSVNLPASCGLFVLSTDIVRVLLERGEFGPADTEATAAALRLYAVGLIGYATSRIASPVFYALGRSRVPVALSLLSVGANVVLSLVLVRWLGFSGLALATSGAALLNATLCLVWLRRQLDGIGGRALLQAAVRIVIASAAMTAVVVVVHDLVSTDVEAAGTLTQATLLLVSILAGVSTLAAMAYVLRIDDLTSAVTSVRNRLKALRAG